MQKSRIANRYQLNQHMKRIPETDYYSATDIQRGQPVTVRTIDISQLGRVGTGLEHLAEDKLRLKVENERKIVEELRRLTHSCLLDILDDGFDDPIYYHVYPPFNFENLQMRVEQNQILDVKTALAYMLQTAHGLAYLHENGIVHCDISADNLLIVDDQIKIIEFSIANFTPVEGGAPGNPFYMSPEAVFGTAPAPARDGWALGVTMVYALTGELPFGSCDMPRPEGFPVMFQQIIREPPRLNESHLILPVKDLVLQMLEKTPDKRFSIHEVVKGIEGILKSL